MIGRGAWLAVMLCLPAAPAAGAPADTLFVAGDVSPAVVRIGERVTVTFRLPLPAEGRALLGPPAPVELGPVDVLVSEPLDTPADSAGWRLEAAFFQIGEVNLAQVPFRLQTETGEIPVRLLPYSISVVSSLPDTLTEAELRPITGPLDVPLRWRWGRILGTGLLVLAGIAALVWWRRRPRTVEAIAPYVPDLPPEVVALRALKELEEESLPARGLIKEHYARLSLILRHYLEGRFHIPAVESTTEEIRESLDRGRQLSGGDRASLLELFDQSDLVKFARWEPGTAAAGEALDLGKGWVNRVAPPPVPGGEG